MTGLSVTIFFCTAGLIGASAYQTSAIQSSMDRIVEQHETMKAQTEVMTRKTSELNDKMGLLVIQGILTEDQKANLPIIMQQEVKKIIAANAAKEASKAVEKDMLEKEVQP